MVDNPADSGPTLGQLRELCSLWLFQIKSEYAPVERFLALPSDCSPADRMYVVLAHLDKIRQQRVKPSNPAGYLWKSLSDGHKVALPGEIRRKVRGIFGFAAAENPNSPHSRILRTAQKSLPADNSAGDDCQIPNRWRELLEAVEAVRLKQIQQRTPDCAVHREHILRLCTAVEDSTGVTIFAPSEFIRQAIRTGIWPVVLEVASEAGTPIQIYCQDERRAAA